MDFWIAHDGGPCPIPNAKAGEYEIKTAAGRIERPKCDASRAGWHRHQGPHAEVVDIVAYRARPAPEGDAP